MVMCLCHKYQFTAKNKNKILNISNCTFQLKSIILNKVSFMGVLHFDFMYFKVYFSYVH